jgi:Flp pilus assembly protein TadB
VSAIYDPHGPDDDTAELGPPNHYTDHHEAVTSDARPTRPQPTTRWRRAHGVTVFCCYLVTLVSAAWLLAEALLHVQALVMVLAVATLIWLGPDARRLYRWLRSAPDAGQAIPVSRLAQLVVAVITVLDLFLFAYALW